MVLLVVIVASEVGVLRGPLQLRQEIVKLSPVIKALGELAVFSRDDVLEPKKKLAGERLVGFGKGDG